jgi:hypothetical protein
VAHAASGTFTSTQTINVQRYGEATPYPSNVEVSGLPEDEIITDVNVTINNYNYYFSEPPTGDRTRAARRHSGSPCRL